MPSVTLMLVVLASMLIFLSFIPSFVLGSFAGKAHDGFLRARHRQHSRTIDALNCNTSKTYTLVDMYQGDAFLDDWDFFTGPDPTHGNVQYQSKADAINKGLAIVQEDGTTILAVDNKTVLPVGGNRDSVRISTKKTYNSGLFIADFFAMPHGCSVWPAYWSVGPNWPGGGEIDILEGVHDQLTNQYTLHTSPGCVLSTGDAEVSGRISNNQCASSGGNNAGCAFIDSDPSTYGRSFNDISGGVYAHLWDSSGIKIWHFPRTGIPADVSAKNPNPPLWGPPAAFWSSASCDMGSHFYEHSLVLDTTICGDWAGATYTDAGCPGSCLQAVSDPTNFKWAQWKINYIATYA